MNVRSSIVKEMGAPKGAYSPAKTEKMHSADFGRMVFTKAVMQKMLPKEVYKNVLAAMDGLEKINIEYADIIAASIKEWAMREGATHFCHWFHPLTGFAAEKHDAFIDWNTADQMIEKFSGKQLVQGEPDASSFPSNHLRNTHEARGYTGWDPTSPIFLFESAGGVTLCIPSIFFSWHGDVLDTKIPLLRSDQKVRSATLRLLKLCKIEASFVYSTLGLEQEYFIIDRSLRNLRPDLVLLGKTVLGASPSKGQELQDHYFASVKERVLSFMQDFETTAIKLGIPVKTRHNEVAPAQHEVAPIYEKSTSAIDHNLLLMEIMRQIAEKHGLACLFHEKPFKDINGSGKHSNWSLSTDNGINLLDPSGIGGNNIHFLILLTAILCAVHKHSALLRASIGSAANDYRLGGHEAPPAILSVYLGEEIEAVLQELELKGTSSAMRSKNTYELGVNGLPEIAKDPTDRNRTSPFAFTGNKFEFRAVGASSNPAFPATVLNLIVAESLDLILNEIEALLHSEKSFSEAVLSTLQKFLKSSKAIRFSGDNYAAAWVEEAKKRGLPHLEKSPEAFLILTDKETIKLFEGVLTERELKSRQEVFLSQYALHKHIEAKLIVDLFKTQILPVALRYQNDMAKSFLKVKEALSPHQFHSTKQALYLKHYNDAIEESLRYIEELEKECNHLELLEISDKAKGFSEGVSHKMEKAREAIDRLETLSDDSTWPLPKYRELLFLV